MSRFEVKYRVQPEQAEGMVRKILSILHSHAGIMRDIQPTASYCVSSLYFDTHDLGCYENHMNGLSTRSKYRLRWYNSNDQVAYLERKTKEDQLQSKIRAELPLGIIHQPYPDLLARINAEALASSANGLLLPMLLAEYERCRYIADNGIEITLDSQLSFSPQRTALRLERVQAHTVDGVIVEVKIPHMQEAAYQTLTSQTQQDKFSKYVHGLELCCDV